jgi:ribonuclease HI
VIIAALRAVAKALGNHRLKVSTESDPLATAMTQIINIKIKESLFTISFYADKRLLTSVSAS